MQRENASMLNALNSHTASRNDAPQATINTASCPASPERVRSYYDVKSSRQYPNISVPCCIATTRVQNTKYPTTPFNWPRQPSFDEYHSTISHSKNEQSLTYPTLATKNWSVVTTTWSNTQSTPVCLRDVVGFDIQRKSKVYTPTKGIVLLVNPFFEAASQ